eukprot:TRINITY_DN109_c1_g1_i1.p1 TRINITY_DN109_c1_g1~~TRINITY_DN109_c1_g1_i1.p1  ORF type:complete len:741 (+),score=223.79 TRINITY_DN109_c1_g1_i1:225-2447(+)
MEKLLPVINKLQDVFNAIGNDPLDLPQIVVVGSQSAGKSSVLEHIVGRDFLPRGSGIVTRRPLVLQLINVPADGNQQAEWGEFLHKPNEPYYDFDRIRQEIENETDRITGKGKGISKTPIGLKIYSPHVLNLTLVDLPGMTRVPVADQPIDIEQQVRGMIMDFISRPNAIILAITAANTDLSNSDALHLAREVDPHGERTVGVITKIDIMDKGTDAMDMLMGRIIPLKLGYIGVVNRSQLDIQNKKTIRDSLKSELDYFNSHPLYRTIANRSGTTFLAKTLNRILIQHIRDCLPELKQKVNKMLAEAQQEILTYGDPLYDTKNSQGALLLQIITQFTANYRDAIDGKLTDLSVNELYGGARVNYIFNEIFAKCLNDIDPTDGLSANDIRTAIRNATGPKAALFIPEVSFELLVKTQISRLEEPSLQCVELVYDELQRIVSQLETKELQRFNALRERVVEVVNGMLNKYKMPTKDMISNLISVELAFINTNHPDFVGGDGAITAILEKMSKAESERQAAANPPQQPLPPTAAPTATANRNPTLTATAPSKAAAAPAATTNDPSFFSTFFGAKSSAAPQQTHLPPTTAQKANPIAPSQPQQQVANKSRASTNAVPERNRYGMPTAPEKLQSVPVTLKPMNKPTDKENFETELIKYLLISYFEIVRKNIKDLAPKSIIHFLVSASKEHIQNELVAALYKEELFDNLLEESPIIAQRRSSCNQMISVLRRAHEILNEVRDFQIS